VTKSARIQTIPRLVGWIAAYAFVLHAVFTGAVLAQLAGATGTPGYEICVSHPDGAPAPAQGQHQHECALHCASLVGFAALAVPLIALIFPLRPIGYVPARRFHAAAPAFFCRAGRSRAPPTTA
jgi:hypothetical protein